jgi:hypothetical protein
MSKAARMALMGFDVDGVLTDGTLYFGPGGDEIKGFSSLDGHGLKMLQRAGIEVAIISGRSSQALAQRAENLGITRTAHGHRGQTRPAGAISWRDAASASPRPVTWVTTWSTCQSCAPADFPPRWPTVTTRSRPALTMSPDTGAGAAACAKSAT